MFNWLTADGAFAGADGNLDWVVPDEEQARTAAAGIAAHDTVLFGRRTYEVFEPFWRQASTTTTGRPCRTRTIRAGGPRSTGSSRSPWTR